MAVRVVLAGGVVDGFVGLAAVDQIAGITEVSVDAETGRGVTLGDAEGVWAALAFRAAVDAFAHALAHLEADLVGSAVEVVGTVAVLMATAGEVARVADVAGWAKADAVLADGPWTALDAVALVNARTWDRALAHFNDFLTALEGVAQEVFGTSAVEGTDGVDAHGVLAADVRCVAFVYI